MRWSLWRRAGVYSPRTAAWGDHLAVWRGWSVTTEQMQPSRGWLTAAVNAVRPLAPRWGPVVVLVTGLVAAGVLLVQSARQLWFFADDWEFLLTRGTVPGKDLGLFTPHNEHWSTIPILVFRAIFAVFGAAALPPVRPSCDRGPSWCRRADVPAAGALRHVAVGGSRGVTVSRVPRCRSGEHPVGLPDRHG